MARRSAWGGIQAAGPGIWRLRCPLPSDPSAGKRRQGHETVHGAEKDASRRLAELRIEHDRFRASPAAMTVSRLWGQRCGKHIERLAPSTVEGCESAYRTATEPTFGERELDPIGKAEAQERLDGMAYGSAKKALAVFRAMLPFAVDNDMRSESPFTKRYQLPPKPQKSSREVSESVHTEAELAAILADAGGERREAPFMPSAFGGLRREEALGAQWGDIGFQDGYAVVRVQRGAQNAKGGVRIVRLRTEGSCREAVVPTPCAQRLRETSFERLGGHLGLRGGRMRAVEPRPYGRGAQATALREAAPLRAVDELAQLVCSHAPRQGGRSRHRREAAGACNADGCPPALRPHGRRAACRRRLRAGQPVGTACVYAGKRLNKKRPRNAAFRFRGVGPPPCRK